VELLVARWFKRCQRSVLCYAPMLAPEAELWGEKGAGVPPTDRRYSGLRRRRDAQSVGGLRSGLPGSYTDSHIKTLGMTWLPFREGLSSSPLRSDTILLWFAWSLAP
jgi:hypothetical protein